MIIIVETICEILDVILYYNCCDSRIRLKVFTDVGSYDYHAARLKDFIALFPDVDWRRGFTLDGVSHRYMRAVIQDGRIIALKRPLNVYM